MFARRNRSKVEKEVETMVLAIYANNLKIGYLDEEGNILWAVKGVDLEIEEKAVFCIVGESGCGKSTLGYAITGILPPYAITHGKLYIFNKLVINDDTRDYTGIRGRVVTYIPQNPGTSLNPYLTIEDQFYYVLKSIYNYDRERARKIAHEYLSEVELEPGKVLDHYPHELSGGMQQRVAIALALSTGAKIVVADEPTSALDAHLRLSIIKLLTRLKDSENLTLILITHDMVSSSRICDEIAVMYSGKIVEKGPGHDMLIAPYHPYTQMLADAVPILGVKKTLRSMPGETSTSREINGCVFIHRCPHAMEKCKRNPPIHRISNHVISCWLYGDVKSE
ncbi:MAG: ABC transporter ATP-binding protein [Desulfurococcaceae archaeon]